jgi:hypothetical protein
VLIKLLVNELVDGEIDYVSLVKHGANRSPIKIMKMDELPEGSKMDNLKDKFVSLFGDDKPEVAALYVHTGVAKEYEPRIEAAGFAIADSCTQGDFTIYKQAAYTDDTDGSLITIDDKMGVALNRVVKDFSSFPGSADFSENIGAASFFPGLHNAMEALAESTFNALNKAENLDEAGSTIDKNLMAFRKHVNALVKNMPSSVIKLELDGLCLETEGSTIETNAESVGKVEDTEMATKLPESVAGDLAGLNERAESDEQALAKEDFTAIPGLAKAMGIRKAAPEAAAEEETELTAEQINELSDEEFEKRFNKKRKDKGMAAKEAETPEVEAETETKPEDELPAGFRKDQRAVKQLVEGQIVEVQANFLINDESGEEIFISYVTKDEAEATAEAAAEAAGTGTPVESADPYAVALAQPLNLIGKALNVQGEALDKIATTLEKQGEKLDDVIKGNKEVVDKTEEVTLVDRSGYQLDESFGTLNHSPVEKGETEVREDVFKGLSPELDALEATLKARLQ